MSEQILYAKNGAVATIRFNRPEKKNALTSAMYAALIEAIDDANADAAIRAIELLGGKDFTAGNDIADFIAAGPLDEEPAPMRFLRVLNACPKPVVAGARGAAIGIGTTMLMHCDAVVLADTVKMAMPFTKLGLVPEAGSSLLLPLIAGRMRAGWMLLSSESFGAQEAERLGLATCVVDDTGVDATVGAMSARLANLPPKSVANTKRLLKAPFGELLHAAMDAEAEAFVAALQSDEARAALMSFVQRRS